jgi:hypothetical protein
MAFLKGVRIGVVAALVAAALGVRPAAQSQGSIEDEVKAAYLFNFTKFVEWPSGAFTGTSDPLNVCVSADEALRHAVERAVTGERVAGRPLKYVAPPPADAAGCHILYLGRGATGHAGLIAAAAKQPILVVGDSPQFLQQGGAIAFVVEERRVRFDIDPAAAARAGLKVSSQLLRVARHVLEGTDTR